MSKRKSRTVGEIRRNYKNKLLAYQRKIRRSIKNFKVDADAQSGLLALLGYGGRSERLLWSDAHAAYVASKRFAAAMQVYRAANPTKHFYFATFKDQCGIASDRMPHVRLREQEAKVRRALAVLKVDGVAAHEVHPLINYPGGGLGRTLLYHDHAIIWSAEQLNQHVATTTLNASRAWSNSLGADPVHIVPIGDTVEDMEAVALYMMKRPYSAKNRMSDDKHPGRFILMDTTAGYRDEFALRIFEGQSQVDLMDTVFGVGEGRVIRQQLNEEMRKWHRARKIEGTIVAATADIWALWLRLRQTAGSKNFAPYRFDASPAPRPVPQMKRRKARRGLSRPRKRVKPIRRRRPLGARKVI